MPLFLTQLENWALIYSGLFWTRIFLFLEEICMTAGPSNPHSLFLGYHSKSLIWAVMLKEKSMWWRGGERRRESDNTWRRRIVYLNCSYCRSRSRKIPLIALTEVRTAKGSRASGLVKANLLRARFAFKSVPNIPRSATISQIRSTWSSFCTK